MQASISPQGDKRDFCGASFKFYRVGSETGSATYRCRERQRV